VVFVLPFPFRGGDSLLLDGDPVSLANTRDSGPNSDSSSRSSIRPVDLVLAERVSPVAPEKFPPNVAFVGVIVAEGGERLSPELDLARGA